LNQKLFIGPRLRRLREQAGLNQAAMAGRLGLSLSYVCQLENNQRPVSAAVLLKLVEEFQCDIAELSEDQDRRLLGELQTIFRDPSLVGRQADRVDIARMVEQVPELASAFIGLAQRHHMLQEEYALVVDRIHGDTQPATLAPLPHEIVRDFFNRRNNHIDSLDRLAEALAAELQLRPGERVAALREALRKQHRIELIRLEEVKDGILRQFDERRRRLGIASGLSDAQQSFQIATQFALIAHQEVIDAEIAAAGINEAQGQALARQGLAHYFAGALLMPYADFLDAARREKYDIEALQRRFAVGFESVCHRLSTLQRSGARGVPFYLVRVDQAGNISKRQSATAFHFARHGGACPLWHVHDAFSRPGAIITQVAEMPDGSRFFGIARTISRGGGGYGAPRKLFSIGLGCELSQARHLVYGDGLDLDAPHRVIPIGPGCRVCPRQNCIQRAFPPAGRTLDIRVDQESLVSYRFDDEAPRARPMNLL